MPSWWVNSTGIDGASQGGAAPVYGPVFEGPADKVIHIPGTNIDVVIADATWRAMPDNLKKAILGAFANWQSSPDLANAINHLQQQGVAAIEFRYGSTYTKQSNGQVISFAANEAMNIDYIDKDASHPGDRTQIAPGSKVIININTSAYPNNGTA